MKHIDKLFKEQLYDHEVAVPDGMWEKIAPIAEEETGRAILWFWFAGLLALLLGGLGIYKAYKASQPDPIDPNALVYEETPQQNNTASLHYTSERVDNEINSAAQSTAKITTNQVFENPQPMRSESSLIETSKTKDSGEKAKASKTKKLASKQAKNIDPVEPISNTVENIGNVTGVPANLVITKSYINEEGSIIKQSNLKDGSKNNNPVYDVIINSEAKDLNAGALLRIIEPLENIPLPAFQKTLKKKSLVQKF